MRKLLYLNKKITIDDNMKLEEKTNLILHMVHQWHQQSTQHMG